MFQSKLSTGRSEKLRSRVYALDVQSAEIATKFHVAVFRDDLHCFVIFATIPAPFTIGLHHSGALEFSLGETLKTDIVDWINERIIFGTTSWLVRRDELEWRAIRQIQLTDDGRVEKLGWLPPGIAEPILRMLEDSVPQTTIFNSDVDNF